MLCLVISLALFYGYGRRPVGGGARRSPGLALAGRSRWGVRSWVDVCICCAGGHGSLCVLDDIILPLVSLALFFQ